MVTKELLRQVIYEQRELADNLGVERSACEKITKTPEILVISGVRRCGKSVLMMQIRASQNEQDYFFSFDDDRLLHFTVEDFQFCCLLKSGLSTLELAEIYCVSESAIFKRRQKIKNQLGFESDQRTLDEIFEEM